MSELSTSPSPKRPEFRNINAFKDLPGYRWPLAAIVSGMHRISGLFMFVLMPFIIWLFDTSLSSEYSFARFTAAFNVGIGFVPGWAIKLLVGAIIWAYLHHFVAGLRHIRMDLSHHAVSKEAGVSSARWVLVLSAIPALAIYAKLFGLY
jgi:succinate dehydrogenase / fumarate reductase, cytochrome b subunit